MDKHFKQAIEGDAEYRAKVVEFIRAYDSIPFDSLPAQAMRTLWHRGEWADGSKMHRTHWSTLADWREVAKAEATQ